MTDKYVANPVEVEAFQVTEEFFDLSLDEQEEQLPTGQFIDIDSKRRAMRPAFSAVDANIGDWLVKSDDHRIVVVKGHDFARQYHKVVSREERDQAFIDGEVARMKETRDTLTELEINR